MTRNSRLYSLVAAIAMLIVASVVYQPTTAEDQSAYTLYGSTPRPVKFFNVTASDAGDTNLVEGVDGKMLLLLSLRAYATDEATGKTSIYIHSGSRDLIGASTSRIPLDKTGIEGYGGVVDNSSPFGITKTVTAGEPITANLDEAQPVIFVGSYVEL